jgi:hypothetical protein
MSFRFDEQIKILTKNYSFLSNDINKIIDDLNKDNEDIVNNFYTFTPYNSGVLSSFYSYGLGRQKGSDEGKIFSSVKSITTGNRKGKFAVKNPDNTIDYLTVNELYDTYGKDLKNIDSKTSKKSLKNSKNYMGRNNNISGDFKGIRIGDQTIFLTSDVNEKFENYFNPGTSTPKVEEVKIPPLEEE